MNDAGDRIESDGGEGASDDARDVLVAGGGVAGLTAGVFTARAGLDTLVVNDGESIVRRNAHLENVPGFPAGVNSHTFLDMLEAQAESNGCELREGRVVELRRAEADGATEASAGFRVELSDGSELGADFVVAASWSDASYLEPTGVDLRTAGSKRYVGEDGLGRTDVEGLYVAGRLAERYHQTVVSAGHGAQTALTLIHDSDIPYYHDWVAPEGYFTDRGREVPPGCEEIDEDERLARERESIETMSEYFDEPNPKRQRTHPSLSDDELNRLPDGDE
ncbi:MAG: FAD-binding protein [Salinigranum sp.]